MWLDRDLGITLKYFQDLNVNNTNVAKCFDVVSVKNKEVKSKLNHFFTQEQTSSMLTLFFKLKFQIYKKLQPQKKSSPFCKCKYTKRKKTNEVLCWAVCSSFQKYWHYLKSYFSALRLDKDPLLPLFYLFILIYIYSV